MKTLFVIGLLFLLGGIIFSSAVENTGDELSDTGSKAVSLSIVGGFTLMILSGILYLRS